MGQIGLVDPEIRRSLRDEANPELLRVQLTIP
jgi:hypothetical protein